MLTRMLLPLLESASLAIPLLYTSKEISESHPPCLFFAWSPGVVCLVAAHHVAGSLSPVITDESFDTALPGTRSSLDQGRNLSPFFAYLKKM